MSNSTLKASYLNVADPTFSLSSEEVRAARERSWFAYTNYGLAILRYDEVNRLLKDRRLVQGSAQWPVRNGIEGGSFAHWWAKTVLNLEGEDHHRIRRLLNPAFAPRLLAGLKPQFESLTNELADGFIGRGECEFMAEFAMPYAARVLAVILGVSQSEWKKMANWSGDIGLALGVRIGEHIERVDSAVDALYGFADDLITNRSAHPRDDLVTRLVLAQLDEDRLSTDELRNLVVLLIFGGMETTRNQLGLALYTFAQHLDQWRALAMQPELGANAVEEVMRVNPVTTWVTREAAADFEFQGLTIRSGTTVHMFCESAGTDPRVMAEPDFDITTKKPSHFAFGGGMHHCLGHFVARNDMSIALPILARRMPEIRIAGSVDALPESGNTGFETLPVAFDHN
ncbi:cytochrome P450 [Gordonia sp. TBRC 11910]|uniref:Cytochrome P450 n=1 Tax=Gordonia asplenii TaxID=2725283 RepID=A0A848KXF9_9ACTN|nr:cytochrome P450 [Gordonia asplenii]NMO00881.1 cytochrome P450 [Gordonia asplenii]